MVNCPVTVSSRKKCAAGRFNKCQVVGMKHSGKVIEECTKEESGHSGENVCHRLYKVLVQLYC